MRLIQKVRDTNKELDDIEAAIEKTITEIPKVLTLKSFLETDYKNNGNLPNAHSAKGVNHENE